MTNAYLQAFNAFPFPCLILESRNQSFVIKDANARYCKLWKVSKEDVLGKQYPFYPEKKKLKVQNKSEKINSLRKVLRTGKPDRIELLQFDLLPSQKEDHRSRFWSVENIPVKDDAGAVVQILNLAIDQTGRHLEKQEVVRKLDQNYREYENFVQKNKDGLYSLDTEGNFLSLNEGLSKLAELPQEEMMKKNFLPFCAAHDKERTLQHFQKALQGENQSFEAEFISEKGNLLVLEITLVPMNIDGNISGIYGIAKDKTPTKERETEFYRNEKKLRAMIHEGSDMVAVLGSDGTYNFVSDSSEKVLGIRPDFFIGRNAFDFIHPDDKERVMADFSLLGKQKQVKVDPFRFKDAEGEWRWMETIVTNQLDDPHLKGIVANSREVTEIVQKSQKIKQLYERYTLAAEATEEVIYDWDLIKDEVIRFHKSTEKLFGYSSKEIDDPTFWKSNVHPEDLPEVLINLKEHLHDPEQRHIKSQYRFRRADGSYANIIDRSSVVRNENGKAIRLIGATGDISEILSNKEALKMANKRFSYAMKATKEIIWDWDLSKGRIKRSSSFKKIFGYRMPKLASAEDFWFQKIVQKDRARIKRSIHSALGNPDVKKWREEYCFRRNNGEEAHVIDRAYILRDRQGQAIRMIGAVLDVTESRRMIEEIQKQNQVLKEVAWEQAHIVKAPLARLKGLLTLLEEESFEEWSRDELVSLIKSSAEEVDEIVENIIRKTEKVAS